MVFLSTAYDILPIKEENRVKGGLEKFLNCFSAKSNFKSLRSVNKSKDIIPIHTARFMSMIVILMGHRFIANSGAPMHNAIFMENAVGNPLFIHLLMSPVLVVDTFFLLSGFLTGNQMLKDFDSKKFKLISGYVHRYIRLTPVYILVVGFYATILYHLGSGPLWKARVSLEQDRCAKNWWTNLLYVNNYVNTQDLCMFQSWHLTCDFHFYLVAPPIVYILWKKSLFGFSLIGILIASVSATLFALTFTNYLDPVLMSFNSVLVDLNSDPTFRITYIPTHTRFIPYLVGIIASYIYYKKKLHIQLSYKHQMISSILILVLSHVPIFTAILFYTPGYEYDRTLASVYAALHRIPWSIAMASLILMGATNNGGLIQPILSWKAFVPLSRLTYCVFLSHGAIQLYSTSSLRTPDYNSKFKILWTLMGDILITYVISLFMHLILEAPILKLDRNYFTSTYQIYKSYRMIDCILQ
ncbi:conserved hypothetical protein [Pediculus humanus corporis]|uniref:Acyltransferase 3 domain-containing protein n=1 Tax=Pediculus humanus subsp. corporis TaxID=121224 RepID=E0VHR7_PEDHC|nr:uncharacterized protein Phum_PHUM210570 [Pediculus humanus corporis]EEB12840.1 conserved hypothetical protein [Pediculus humanus corporis]